MHSRTAQPATHEKPDTSILFLPLLTLTLIMWVLYRSLFTFPVWFDETVGKAVFFGLPVWLFITATRTTSIMDSFAGYKMKYGLMLGIALGGIFGFVGSLLSLAQRGQVVEAVWLFNEMSFWREFFLALLTAFWETLLFFSFVMTMVQQKYRHWTDLQQILLVTLIFVLFHIPNALLRYSPEAVAGQVMLLGMFGLGQAYLFASSKNAYALVLSHAIWGMVLLIHSW